MLSIGICILLDHRPEDRPLNSLFLPNNFTNHRPHNANIPIKSTSQHSEDQSLPKRSRETKTKAGNRSPRKTNQQHSFPTSVITGSTPQHRSTKLCRSKRTLHNSSLGSNDRVR